MTSGINWPVVLIEYTSVIWAADIVNSMNMMKQAIVMIVIAWNNMHAVVTIFLLF